MQKDMLNELKEVKKWVNSLSSSTEWTYNMESIKQLWRLNKALENIIKSIEASRIATGKIKWWTGIDFYDNTIHLSGMDVKYNDEDEPTELKNNDVLFVPTGKNPAYIYANMDDWDTFVIIYEDDTIPNQQYVYIKYDIYEI